jgi:hypothetical protein
MAQCYHLAVKPLLMEEKPMPSSREIPPPLLTFPQEEANNETAPSFISKRGAGDSDFGCAHSRRRPAGMVVSSLAVLLQIAYP